MRNMVPNPMNTELAMESLTSLAICRVNLFDVTSYTKNQAVKNKPINNSTVAN